MNFILACLNSSFIKNYWKAKYSDNKALFPKIKGFQLKELPIPIVNLEQQVEITDFVDKIIESNGTAGDLEKLVDHMICKLYGMTEEEIAVVEATIH